MKKYLILAIAMCSSLSALATPCLLEVKNKKTGEMHVAQLMFSKTDHKTYALSDTEVAGYTGSYEITFRVSDKQPPTTETLVIKSKQGLSAKRVYPRDKYRNQDVAFEDSSAWVRLSCVNNFAKP